MTNSISLNKRIPLDPLLKYFDNLSNAMNEIFPDEITWDNCHDYNIELNYSHPEWVKLYFPINLIYFREKAGKLRKSKSENVMYQNSNNILTQIVVTADDFGIHFRKNKHKGYNKIIGGIKLTNEDIPIIYSDKIQPKKFRNFIEFYNCEYLGEKNIKEFAEAYGNVFKCDSQGQLRIF